GFPSLRKTDGLGTAGFDDTMVLDRSEPAIEPVKPVHPAEAWLPISGVVPEMATPRQPSGSFGRAVNIHLDKRVPLLPHAVDISVVEQYHRLRTKIQQQHAVKPIRSLMVASPGPGEGKTLTVMNLGLSF